MSAGHVRVELYRRAQQRHMELLSAEYRRLLLRDDQPFQRVLHRHAAVVHPLLAKGAGTHGLDPNLWPLRPDLGAVGGLLFLPDPHYQMDVPTRSPVSKLSFRGDESELFQYFLKLKRRT